MGDPGSTRKLIKKDKQKTSKKTVGFKSNTVHIDAGLGIDEK